MFEAEIKKPTIAIITSLFNEEVTQKLYEGAKKRFEEKNIIIDQKDTIFVPGAVEIPVIAARFASTKKYDAIVCLGAVIRGETDHYDYVCWQVSYGCQQVAIQYDVPVVFGVLTTDNEEQAHDRCGGKHGHKGVEAADVALEMIEIMKKMKEHHNIDDIHQYQSTNYTEINV